MAALGSDPATRASLLLRLRDPRDNAAWSEFAVVYEPLVYRLAQRRGCQDADAREIVQEVFLTVSRAIDRFDPNAAGSFRGWLSKIARNATIDRFRRLAAERVHSPDTHDGLPLEQLADSSMDAETQLIEEFERGRREQLFRWASGEVRRRTGEANWMAFWRTTVEGHSVAQVAQELKLTDSAVYVARCRILRRIRELVATRWEE
ncbi:RNA polymerase sigma factor [Roseimaritima ulvae]|uniref:ECF RNA polymerase sigma factor SigE n=1 Tax=Roseimaritima ulvae TaxID=980254 RepID=A0A5B9QXD4_9BACT|nr:sigma-70 family RNA polymerase sigma factor [Roseimaritima ulvae]QEG42672.1 ECF RNA polymerase sigma factor SigE [Roseimaritima ulvae]